jgi:hypothetical protein
MNEQTLKEGVYGPVFTEETKSEATVAFTRYYLYKRV